MQWTPTHRFMMNGHNFAQIVWCIEQAFDWAPAICPSARIADKVDSGVKNELCQSKRSATGVKELLIFPSSHFHAKCHQIIVQVTEQEVQIGLPMAREQFSEDAAQDRQPHVVIGDVLILALEAGINEAVYVSDCLSIDGPFLDFYPGDLACRSR